MGTIDEKSQLILDSHLNIPAPSRVKVIILVNNYFEYDIVDTPVGEIKTSLKRALQEVKAGQTRPISELWNRIDD